MMSYSIKNKWMMCFNCIIICFYHRPYQQQEWIRYFCIKIVVWLLFFKRQTWWKSNTPHLPDPLPLPFLQSLDPCWSPFPGPIWTHRKCSTTKVGQRCGQWLAEQTFFLCWAGPGTKWRSVKTRWLPEQQQRGIMDGEYCLFFFFYQVCHIKMLDIPFYPQKK